MSNPAAEIHYPREIDMFRPFSRKAAADENRGPVDAKPSDAKRPRAFGKDITNATGAVAAPGAAAGDVFKNPLSVLTSVTTMTLSAVGGAAAAVGGSGSGGEAMAVASVSDPSRPYMDRPSDDIDARDAENPLLATAYVNEMYEIYHLVEKESQDVSNYMIKQGSINEKMRTILVDWLVRGPAWHACVLVCWLTLIFYRAIPLTSSPSPPHPPPLPTPPSPHPPRSRCTSSSRWCPRRCT